MASTGFPESSDSLIIARGGAYAPATATLCSLIIFLWVLLRFSVKRKNTLGSRLPPGPFSWPIIGNLNQLRKLPHRDLHALAKKYGPIMMLKLGSVPTVVVSSSAMAKEFLKTHDLVFASRPLCAAGKYLAYNYKDMAFAPYGPYWRHIRKLCVAELLNTRRIDSFRYVREEEMLVIVRSVWEMSGQGRKPVNVTNLFSSFGQAVMWRILSCTKISFHGDTHLGGHGEEIKKMAAEAAATIGLINIGDFIPYLDWMDLQGVKRRMKKVHESFDQVVSKIVEEHQQRKAKLQEELEQDSDTKDIIDLLLEMESLDGMPITKENIKAIVFGMYLAGIETTTTTSDWAMSEIIRHPRVAKKMREEIDSVVGRERVVSERNIASMEYVQCVLKETLRLYPAAPFLLPHESTQDCTVGGYFIPERTRLMNNAWAIGRDPSLWEDPLEFRPERFLGKNIDFVRDIEYFDMLPFGVGRRGCPGVPMASVTVNLMLAQLVHCFEWTVEGDLDMTEVFGGTTPRRDELLACPALRLSTCP
ncbi:hypothetical protein SUGI_0421020 [Cryptomeria japonica]|uniref:cytochrome P450 750A1-like n=1 Tax=Cryptomeria japonica TaxID=3369 RepID=UPI0024089694|nr:cytochrome P450 750A1-like [Cryptomeria japonica]GLJ22366.1 hypothetical protein SUGI_0421020 [Cryptomeria japonica]